MGDTSILSVVVPAVVALCGAYAKNETLSLGLAGQYFTGLYVHVPFSFFTDWLYRRLGAKPVVVKSLVPVKYASTPISVRLAVVASARVAAWVSLSSTDVEKPMGCVGIRVVSSLSQPMHSRVQNSGMRMYVPFILLIIACFFY